MIAEAAGATAELVIDLSALRANWRLLADKVAPVECAAVIKADGYGIGLEPAARALWAEGCRTFFVARLSEGVRARATLPQATIYMLDGLTPGAAATLKAHALRPALGAMEEIAEWGDAGPAALHFDTGMNRLGLAPSEVGVALAALGAKPTLVMSHFTSSEFPDATDNARQEAAFAAVEKEIRDIPASLCNSSGIFLASHPWRDMVRPGYALYGGNPTPHDTNPMRAVAHLTATMLKVRTVPRGDCVGYNRTWTARRDSRIAIVGVGYADGVPRGAMGTDDKRGPDVMIGDARCPIVGRVSMDLIAIDATDARAGDVGRGAPVEFLGARIGVDEFAAHAGTIGYEILTGLGRRYRRVYRGG